MILGLFVLLIFLGIVFGFCDFFIPGIGFMGAMGVASFRFMGLAFIVMAAVVISARLRQTGADMFCDLPNKNSVILLHSRRGRNPNASLIHGKLIDLEFIKAKRKLFKDTGGGVRICGHDVRFTHETIAHDIPLWLGEYFHKIKEKYGVRNNDELQKLYLSLKTIKEPLEGVMSLKDQLSQIEALKPIMADNSKAAELCKMSIDEIHNMAETIFDGFTIHMEDAEDFIDSATPNELDSLMTQETAHQFLRFRGYRDPGEVNWSAWVGPAVMLLIGGAIAVAVISGVFH